MLAFLRGQWLRFRASYSAEEVGSISLAGILLPVAAMLGGFGIPAYWQPLAAKAQFRVPWLPVLLVALALPASLLCKRVRAEGNVGAACTLVDTVLYVTAFASAAAVTRPGVSLAYASVYGLLLVGVYARYYSLTWVLALSLGGSLLGVLVILQPAVDASIALIACCVVGLYWSYYEGKNKRLRRENLDLRSALTVSDQLTHRSMDLALTHVLLEVGHFLHEMRNRQMSMGLAVEFLRRGQAGDEDFQEALTDLRHESQEIRTLIERFVAVLRRESRQESSAFDLGKVVEAVSSERVSDVVVRLDNRCRHCQVVGDSQQLTDALKNVMRNARQAGARNISLGCIMEASASSVRVVVEDDGPGLSDEALAALFRPFASFGTRGGTGLGLYLAKRQVEMMGGQIEAANGGEGGGARFTIRLPARVGEDTAADRGGSQETDTSTEASEHARSE